MVRTLDLRSKDSPFAVKELGHEPLRGHFFSRVSYSQRRAMASSSVITLLFLCAMGVVFYVVYQLCRKRSTKTTRRRSARHLPHCSATELALREEADAGGKPPSFTGEAPLLYVEGAQGYLYIDMYLDGKTPTIFFVDTGYGGAPVINPWHEARERQAILRYGESTWHHATLEQRISMCEYVEDSLAVPRDDFASVNTESPEGGILFTRENDATQFARRHSCSSQVSSCRLRLAGISSDSERVTDMVVCPRLAPERGGGRQGGRAPESKDVMVTMFNQSAC